MEETVLLLDCGEPCSHTMVKHGVPADLIDAILISHLHSDHVGGFPMVMQWLWLAGRVERLPVYMPREGISAFKQMLRATYLFDELLKFGLELKPVSTKTIIKVGPLKIRSEHNRHLEGFRVSFQKKYRNAFESFSYRINGRKASVVYSGDLAAPSDLDPLLKQRTNVLVVELAHFEPESLFRALAEKEIDQIVVTHLGAHIQTALPRTRKLASKYFPKEKVIFASDGTVVEF